MMPLIHKEMLALHASNVKRFSPNQNYRLINEILPRWFVTESDALPPPKLPTTRRPSLRMVISGLEKEPSTILRVEGAVATRRNDELKGIRRFMLPRMEVKR